MRSTIATLVILVAATATASQAAHSPAHEMVVQAGATAAQPNAQLAVACVQSQQRTLAMAEQLSRRVEAARRSAGPADLRMAIDDLQTAWNQIRTASQACAVTPGTPAPGVADAKPAAAMDHAAMGHAAPTAKPVALDPQLVSACVESQRQVTTIADRMNRSLELARQTNAATEMQAGMAAVPPALVETRAALQKCEPLRTALVAAEAAATATVMDHSKMAMPGAPGTQAGVPPAAPMDHSKMAMGAAAPAAKPGAPGAKPTNPAPSPAPLDHSKMPMGNATPTAKPGTAAGATTTKPAASPTPMDHSKMPMAGTAPAPGGDHTAMKMDTPKLPVMPAPRIPDPACSNNVTQANAPKAVYQRKVYYFCSTADRDLFRKDPAAYLKKRPR